MPWRTPQARQVEIAHLHYTMNDAAYLFDMQRETDLSAFYFAMRNNTAVKTIAVLPEAFIRLWEPILASGRDVLMLTLSRYLSKTFLAAQHARESLLGKYPSRRILIVDTLCSSMPQGMLVYEAVNLREEGQDIDAVADWVIDNRLYINALLLPGSLRWLREGNIFTGGAISDFTGKRPLLLMDDTGFFSQIAKCRDEEDALHIILEATQRLGYALNRQVVGIVHADAPELAKKVKKMLMEEAGCGDAAILPMGPIAGCYAGPDAIGVAFFGSGR